MSTITRSHDAPAFTADELKSLITDARVFFFDPFGATDGYPYVVLAEKTPPHYYAADAWYVNEIGQKRPGHIYPAPVVMREISDIGFADPELRRSVVDFADRKLSTWVFGQGDGPGRGDPMRVHFMGKALGVGANELAARVDAMERLKIRVPGLSEFSDGQAADAHTLVDRYSCLYAALRDGKATVLSKEPGGYPAQKNIGHEYMNHETEQAAAGMSSSCAAAVAVEQATSGEAKDDAQVWKICLTHARQSGCISSNSELAAIDWAEVLDDLTSVQVVQQAPMCVSAPAVTAAMIQMPVTSGKVAGRAIADDVLRVLVSCRVQGDLVYLPPQRLDPKLYKRVNEVLVALGGKWTAGKVQAHKFEEDPSAVIAVAVHTGSHMKPQDFGFFPTPAALVERVLRQARIEPGMRVLEPQGGTGAFAVPMAARAGGKGQVTVCELLPGNVKKLQALGFTDVHQGDFLQMEPQPVYDFIAMNPPFSNGADIEHVMHATRFLKPEGQLLAITAPGWEFYKGRAPESFREFVREVDAHVESVESGAFRESGTDIATRIIAMDACNFPWHSDAPISRSAERMRG